MTRVDELQKRYPSIARDVIVKWETLRYGVRDSDALYKGGSWKRAGGGYQSLDHGLTLEEMAKRRPQAVKPGYVFFPGSYYTRNGIGARIERDPASPYEIREESAGRFVLYEGEDRVEDVYFVGPKPLSPSQEMVTSKGTPVTSLVDIRGRCFGIAPLRYCEFFDRGVECKFCNYNWTHDQTAAMGGKHAVALDLEDAAEAFRILGSNIRIVEGRYQSGAISDDEKESKLQFRFVERIARANDYTPNMTMSVPPMSRRDMERLKDAGLSCIHFNLEVWGAEMFAEVCPGKSMFRGHDRYMEAYLEAVDVFGAGRAGCNFVAGVSLMPANGHKTWQESRDSLIEGLRWLIKHGLFSTFHSLRLGAGSVYGDNRSNVAKLPPTEYFLDAGLAHHEALMETGLYKTYNKLMFCPLDCQGPFYMGDITMMTVAGNPANWIADTIPSEANWLARFVASRESQEAQSQRPG